MLLLDGKTRNEFVYLFHMLLQNWKVFEYYCSYILYFQITLKIIS